MTTDTTTFNGKFVVLGFGSLGPSTVSLLNEQFPDVNVVIISDLNTTPVLSFQSLKHLKAEFVDQKLSPKNYIAVLSEHVSTGDFVVNLTVDVSCADLIYWCQLNGVLYTDTALYDWAEAQLTPLNYEARYTVINQRQPTSTTALIAHGANPGLVNHFVKYAIDRMNANGDLSYAERAKQIGIQTIHISEVDSQWSPDVVHWPNDFVNTWSVQGFINEAALPAELTVGTHEGEMPSHEGYVRPDGSGYFYRSGGKMRMRSWNPVTKQFEGLLITHNESISLGQFLSTKDYRPSVYYVYRPTSLTLAGLHDWWANDKKIMGNHVMINHLMDTYGTDSLGVLIMGRNMNPVWVGNILSGSTAFARADYAIATTLQVTATLVAGIHWVIENPHRGIVEAEAVDHTYILPRVIPYIGDIDIVEVDWDLLKNHDANLDLFIAP